MNAGRLILLVEDNSDDQILARRAFRANHLDCRIVVARDGVEALALLLPANETEAELSPDLILLDLKLPRLDGFEVLRRLRGDGRTRKIPVVVLTTSSEERDVERGYHLGANSYVRKPVDFDQFRGAILQIWNYWFALNQLPPSRRGGR